jgi:hypothetical protein
MNKASETELYRQLEKDNDIVGKYLYIKAVPDADFNLLGWIFPGGLIVSSKENAIKLTKQLDNIYEQNYIRRHNS